MHRKYSALWTAVLTVPLAVNLIVVGMLALPRSQALAAEGPSPLPTAVDLNPDPGIFETVLVALEVPVALGIGPLATAQTFNATIPGPAFRLKVGDRVIVHFANFLKEPASIHWHGIELDNASDGTGITQNPVRKGELFTYKFIVPRPGIFFYHSHIMPTNPEFKGYYGPILVEDPAEQELERQGVLPSERKLSLWPSLRDLRLGNPIMLVVGDTTVCKAPGSNDPVTFPADSPSSTLPWAGPGPFPGLTDAPTPKDLCETPRDHHGHPLPDPLPAGAIPNIQPRHRCSSQEECRTNEGQLVLTNGRVPAARGGSPSAPGALAGREAVFPVLAGDGVSLQLASATATRYLRLRMTDQQGQQVTLFRIGGQGGLLDRVRVEGGTPEMLDTKYVRGEILLPVAAREDVVFVPRGQVGDVLTLWTLDYSRTGRGFSGLPTVPVAHFRIVGAAEDEPPLSTGSLVLAELLSPFADGHATDAEPAGHVGVGQLTGLEQPAGVQTSFFTLTTREVSWVPHHGGLL